VRGRVEERAHVSLADGRYFVVDGSVAEVATRLNAGAALTPLASGDMEIWINADHVLHVRPDSDHADQFPGAD
jgi:hypothetical protein